MNRRRRSRSWSGAAFAVCLFAIACGEEGKAVGDACQDVPLYRLVYDGDAKAWVRVAPDGGALSAEDNARIDEEQNRDASRCLTPLGTAISNSAGAPGSTGGRSGESGGTSATGGETSSGGSGTGGSTSGGTDGGDAATDAGRDASADGSTDGG
jgi:hypothetical protein